MAIRATIRSRKRGCEGYDIDIVVELVLPPAPAHSRLSPLNVRAEAVTMAVIPMYV
jgi:hypothetical protein